ncbi:hypothetical protein JCM21900_002128 [Sporobolomyces salmonicolor]
MVQLNKTFEQLAVAEHSPAWHAKVPTRPRPKPTTSSTAAALPESTRQLVALLSRLFTPFRTSPTFTPTLQHVKGLLYNKQYLEAFATDSDEGERWREVYVSRWTPARALMYERILRECGVAEALGWAEEREDGEREVSERRREKEREAKAAERAKVKAVDGRQQEKEVIMIGAGAGSEVLGLACVLGSAAAGKDQDEDEDEAVAERRQRRPRVTVKAIDQGSWGALIGKMGQGIREEWPVLAGELQDGAAGDFEVEFIKGDVLQPFSPAPAPSDSSANSTPSASHLLNLDYSSPSLSLITICFTISELLLQSRLSTLRFLSHLTSSSPSGVHLLIVESASLALIPLGKSGRTYPLGQLLDHALCGDGKWNVVKSEETQWYRMPEGAEEAYNRGTGTRVKLENSRVVIRLYRKK